MPNVLLLLVLALPAIKCVLSTPEQNFILRHDRLEMDEENPEFVKIHALYNKMYNRTTRTFGGLFTTKKDMARTLQIVLQAYQLRSNRYHLFTPFRISMPFCDLITRNVIGLGAAMKQHSNLTACPIKAATYLIRDVFYDGSGLPPRLILGDWRLALQFRLENKMVAQLSWYGALLPKKPDVQKA